MFGTILKRAGFGFLLGTAIGTLMAILFGWPDGVATDKLLAMAGGVAPALLWQMLLSGVLGAVSFAGTCLYKLESWPLLRIAVVHYLIIEAVYLPVAFIVGWVRTTASAGIQAGCQAIVYAIIFFIMWARYRAQVKQANELIEHRKETTGSKETV